MTNFLLVMIGFVLPLIFSYLGYQNHMTASIVTVSSLIWPGYLVTTWLWPDHGSLSFEKRLCLTPVFSILMILGASIIYWFALNSISTKIILLIVASIVFVGSIVRRSPQNIKGRDILVLYGFVAFLSAFMTFISSNFGIHPQGTTDHADVLSEFYLVDPDNPVGFDQGYAVQVGIGNLDSRDHAYLVDVYAGDQLLNRTGPLSVTRGNRSVYSIDIPLPSGDYSGPVDIYLFRESDTTGTPFRRLRIWFE